MLEKVITQEQEEPVYYCPICYSLRIKYEDAIGSDCCMDCGCTDIESCSIDEWENKYEKRFGHKYLVEKKDVRNSPIFKLSLDKLKSKVLNHPSWRKIIHLLYPKFPSCYGKEDSIILLFDKLVKDNRVDDIKYLLIKNSKH